jgi:outer membrane PBP1 activator LpoA protein
MCWSAHASARWCSLAIVVALVAACAGPQRQSDTAADQAPPQAELRERAQALIEQGEPLAAVRVYRRLAERADAGERLDYQLRITELLFDTDYTGLALAWHRRLEGQRVPAAHITRKRLVDARAAVARRQGVRALRHLPMITSDTPDDVRVRILAIRADAYAVTGEPVRALEARLTRAPYLATPAAREANNEAIWTLLQSIPADRLETLIGDTRTDPRLRGWAALAQAVRRARLGERSVKRALADWRDQYSDHSALAFSRTLENRVLEAFEYPDRIALLLPLSGRLAEPAAAIRDGILAAYYDQPDYVARPQIAIYDTGDKGTTASAAYERAVDEGAGFVVGPLAKDAVAKLAGRDALEVPVLTLNYARAAGAGASGHDRLYQFGLLPEDEARQAADAAIQNEHFNALVLAPSGSWGRRMLGAFRERFDEVGGQTLEIARYDDRRTDYGRPIEALLNLDASGARHRRLQSIIERDARFEPRRRQDVDVIYAPTRSEQARLIMPQLAFHRAAEVPVYASSHAFTGHPDADAYSDVNGLNFTETPWILDGLAHLGAPDGLHRRVIEGWPQRHRRLPRLYALGIDAFSVVPHLGRLSDDETAGRAGRAGRLTVDDANKVHRKLRWARFVGGVPMAVPRPEAPIGPHFDDWLGLDRSDGGDGP